jgi:hypothetical protein
MLPSFFNHIYPVCLVSSILLLACLLKLGDPLFHSHGLCPKLLQIFLQSGYYLFLTDKSPLSGPATYVMTSAATIAAAITATAVMQLGSDRIAMMT